MVTSFGVTARRSQFPVAVAHVGQFPENKNKSIKHFELFSYTCQFLCAIDWPKSQLTKATIAAISRVNDQTSPLAINLPTALAVCQFPHI